ncbi:MAG: hydrogen gas-evolving membrane-bound hydrogenase subunit E [Verrucomicrobiota bacterium]|nr:hydrogen gas-evolving membrane-bound hydrogenase subunit E [Verrucomicrobiota bacterium]
MKIFGLIAVLVVGILLLSATSDFPSWGDPRSAPSDGEVSTFYIEKTQDVTKVPNMVTAVLADFRGYDTMFETVVIFIAGIGIIAVLRNFDGSDSSSVQERRNNVGGGLLARFTCSLILPFIQIFALYVVAHGHHSPGGGFQGGVMLGASYILLALAFGLSKAKEYFSERRTMIFAAVGIFIYAGWGVLCLLFGKEFLNYSVLDSLLPGDAEMARSHSMLIVEIGVAFTVTAIMFSMYSNLSTRGRLSRGL